MAPARDFSESSQSPLYICRLGNKHSQWRKVAKKLRRKRIRQEKARERDKKLLEEQQRLESSPTYQEWLVEQMQIEQERLKEEELQAAQREEDWLRAELIAQKQWRELQKKIALAREEKIKQNMKIKLEWEREQQRLKEIEIAKEKEREEKRLQQEKREKELLDFLEQGGDTPDHLKTEMQTNPGKQDCPFFKKVSACRFFDVCSRNHIRPGISKTLLFTNFFSDISLDVKENEHGSDTSLEFEKEDTYNHYKEFFYDVVSELEKCGRIRKLITCCNHEPHLRGNVYVQYNTTREALVTYHKFNGRWYGGKQLNIEFCRIQSWGKAVCGLFFKNRCPKGNSCNFLHIFRNPENMYSHSFDENKARFMKRSPGSDNRTSTKRLDNFEDSWDVLEKRNWTWSPELQSDLESSRTVRKERRSKRSHRSNDVSSKNRRTKSRSRSRRKDDKNYSESSRSRRRSKSKNSERRSGTCKAKRKRSSSGSSRHSSSSR